MIIWLHDRLFANDRQGDLALLTLLRNAAARGHTLIISNSPNSPFHRRSSSYFEQWISTFPVRLEEELKLIRQQLMIVSANSTVRGTGRLLVSARKIPDGITGCQISLEEAVRAAAQPLYVLVENQINDAAFLRRVMPPVWSKKLLQWESEGKLRYEHSGGIDTMRNIVMFYTQDDKARLAFGLPAQIWQLGHFIIYDHDGKNAENPSQSSMDLKKICVQNRSHRLLRRCQENYLPKEVMLAIIEKRITDPNDRIQRRIKIDQHCSGGDQRHFTKLDKLFKNGFTEEIAWVEDWFKNDGSWPEMTELAEKIAAAM
ncbi:MAG: hypothetical protein CDV28_11550 [Candidatus Electronema aureum]|uniref:Uncharacterized protein n=1 Tax=Candidatus Electronema aureum TaxID=2005002 RepID=A0A521G1M5_9BACT|nr:MAG: hypothetical protein CDV28_11550 [Candidatus Electronema aureum]